MSRTVERCGRGWVVDGLHAAGPDDVSPAWFSNPPTYDPACGWCWLGAPHTADAHRVQLGGAR